MREIYINSDLDPLTEFSTSNRSSEFKNIFLWNHLSDDHVDLPSEISSARERVSPFELEGKSLETREFPNGVKVGRNK